MAIMSNDRGMIHDRRSGDHWRRADHQQCTSGSHSKLPADLEVARTFAGHAARMSTPDAATVLVVDDEPNVRDLLSATLRLSGFNVHTVGDSAAALIVAGAYPPDAMVLNAVLPDGDGFALARRLRNGHDNVPVLFLAARDSVAERIAGLTAGGD